MFFDVFALSLDALIYGAIGGGAALLIIIIIIIVVLLMRRRKQQSEQCNLPSCFFFVKNNFI